MANSTTHIVRGVLHWAKVLGKPRMNTFTGENEWSVDLTPNPQGLTEIRRLGLEDRLKTPKSNDERKQSFVTFRHREKNKDGDLNAPIRIQDVQGQPWPENKLIGNGTVADVKFVVRDYGVGKRKGMYIQAIRVLELNPYVAQDFAPLSEEDEFFAEGGEEIARLPDGLEPEVDDDLNDDVPF